MLLLLLAACGPAEKAPKDSVTVNLPAAGAPIPPGSVYTSLEPASCQAASPARRCEGSAGYALEISRRTMTVIGPDASRSAMDLSKLTKGSTARLGAKAEWRGAAPGHPTALIFRLNRSLMVARLASPACVVAIIGPQPGQNEKAREIADGKLPACLQG